MRAGDRVEVRTRYDGSWAKGFSVAEVHGPADEQFLIRRDSDGAVLPQVFTEEELRPTAERMGGVSR
jgi:hypothetical protein